MSKRPDQRLGDRNALTLATSTPHCDREAKSSIRVMIASNMLLFADAISALVQTDPELEVVGEIPAQCTATAPVPPDIVLIDGVFATESCVGLVRAVTSALPSARALVICRDLNDDDLIALVAGGALGHLALDRGRDDLIDAIKRLHQGDVLFPARLLVRLLARQHALAMSEDFRLASEDAGDSTDRRDFDRASVANLPVALAPRERQVLEATVTGLSTEEVAERLGITVHTVRTHLRNTLTKLGVHSKLEAVVVALRKGLIEWPE